MYKLPKGYCGELVAAFDCTKHYDSDVFFQKEGVHLVESSLGTYLETSDDPLSRFGYRFQLKHVNKPHMLIVSYPDDKRRHMMINDCLSFDTSTGIFTDEEYKPTNTVREIHRIFYPRTTDMTLVFMSWGKNEPAAAFGFVVYELEELKESRFKKYGTDETRKFGVQYEDPGSPGGDLGTVSYEEWMDRVIEYEKHVGRNMIIHPINWYSGPLFDSKKQPAECRFGVALPERRRYVIVSTKPADRVTAFLDKCESAGIDFVGGMTLLRLGNLMKNMNVDMESIAAGADTYNNVRFDNKVQVTCNDWTTPYNAVNEEKMVAEGYNSFADVDYEKFEYAYGEPYIYGGGSYTDTFRGAPIFNPLHPEVQRQLVEYFEEISEKYGRKKAFKGVSINIWHGTFIWFCSLQVGYDDYTVNLFTKETGIQIPCEPTDPDRFRKRYDFLIHRNRKLWIDWRCKKIHELILKLRDALRTYNSSLDLYLCAWVSEPMYLHLFGAYNESTQYPAVLGVDDILKEGGINLSLFTEDEGIHISVSHNQHRDSCDWQNEGAMLSEEKSHVCHDLNYMDDSWTKVIKQLPGSGSFTFDTWTEGWGKHISMPFNRHEPGIDKVLDELKVEEAIFYEDTCKMEEDGFWFDCQWQITSCFPPGRNYLEPFAHAVAEWDSLYLLRGGLYHDGSHAKEMQEYASVFTNLPAIKFDTVQGSGDPVVVRELNRNGQYYVYAVNREPYNVTVKIKLERAANVCNLRVTEEGSIVKEIELELKAFGIEAFVCSEENHVVSYETLIPETEWEKYKRQYEEQMNVFQWLKQSQYCIAGAEQIEAQLVKAYVAKQPARIRHILNCYVSAKAREFYKSEFSNGITGKEGM